MTGFGTGQHPIFPFVVGPPYPVAGPKWGHYWTPSIYGFLTSTRRKRGSKPTPTFWRFRTKPLKRCQDLLRNLNTRSQLQTQHHNFQHKITTRDHNSNTLTQHHTLCCISLRGEEEGYALHVRSGVIECGHLVYGVPTPTTCY